MKVSQPVINSVVKDWKHLYGHGRPHIGANGVSWPPEKMDEKLKSENMQKRGQSAQADVENGATLTTYLFRYTSECTIS